MGLTLLNTVLSVFLIIFFILWRMTTKSNRMMDNELDELVNNHLDLQFRYEHLMKKYQETITNEKE